MYDLQTDELRERVAGGVKRQKTIYRWTSFAMSVLFFFIAVIMVVTSAPSSELGEVLLGPMIFWIGTLIFHFVAVLVESGVMDKQIASQIVARELGQQFMESQAMLEKRKRTETDLAEMTIDDEGELVPLHRDEGRTGHAQHD